MNDHKIHPGENSAETMRKTMQELYHHEEILGNDPSEVFTDNYQITTPKGREIHDLTSSMRQAAQYLKPARRCGTATLMDLQSLVDWTNRFKGDTSILFANTDMERPSLTCIADYHAAGPVDVTTPTGDPSARHCHHRAIYRFPLSDEWKAWIGISGEPLDKDELGEFIEINAKDVMDPTPAIIANKTASKNTEWENRLIETAQKIEGRYGQLTKLLKMSKRFQVYESSNLTIVSNRDTGEGEIQFVNEHKTAEGKPINIPNLIIIAVPVFEGGPHYRMPVRFRYRKKGGKIYFFLSPYNPEKAFKAAADEALKYAENETNLPLLRGTPES
jgi:uncharacterized protein YfdQ (DUF2303 family)